MVYLLRYCAFVDVLGFSELILRLKRRDLTPENLQNLLSIVHAPPSEYQADLFQGSSLQSQSISDAVCLSAAASEAGLAHLLYCLDQLALRLLEEGFFVRGAIVKGRLFHDEQMVFGEALVNAYKLESEVARYPRIMIARDVAADIKAFYEALSHQTEFSMEELQFIDCVKQAEDGPYYLDVLREISFALNDERSAAMRNVDLLRYNRIADKIQARFAESADTPRHFEKVQWFARYWNEVFASTKGVQQIKGPGVTPKWIG